MTTHKVTEKRQPEVKAATAQKPRWNRLLHELRAEDLTLDLLQVMQHLLKLLQKVAPNHAAGLFLLDEEARTFQVQITDLFDRDLRQGKGALGTALRNSTSFEISRFSDGSSRSSGANPTRSQLVVPFRASPQVRGALILRSPQPNAYSQKDGEALSQFALQAAAAIESALIHQRVLREAGGEVEQDLVMAQEIMARLIPRKPPEIVGVEVASVNIPAKIVGGDFLDFIVLPDNHYGFLVADAAGNGIPSALLMTGFRALFRGLIQNDFNIRSVFRKANQQLIESTAPHQFVSAFYAALDASTRRLIYVNGGHVTPLLYRPSQPSRNLDVGGPVLGILPAASYHEDSVVLRSNDILVLYSDGLSEAENAAGQVFDSSRILKAVEKNRNRSAEAICAALQEEVHRLVGLHLQDDLTICVLKFL
ncbi:MAG: SpoIIE family protein phosphatase [Acidobacteria bacterium]|nr:SpoIIE family protein phosphatase [Acidobacteriota bacterium]